MAIESMFGQLRDNWGWVMLRGVAAILFGVVAFAWPGATLLTLAIFWGFYALADGVLAIIAGFRIRDRDKPVWPMVLIGIAGIVAGIVTIVWPGLTASLLLLFIAFWAIFMGVFQIVTAIRIRHEIDNEWMLILSGALSVVFGLAMVAAPGLAAVVIVWTLGAYAIIFGVLLVVLGFKLKGLKDEGRFRSA
jgi:uncharacterized membrane protein HdeD (DUF308 family)